ncbi:MAG: SIMPL domain-containing protein [Ideonella sp.]|nr:SIMPL domain-containing protein [Ideonella sp.]
MNPKSLWLQRRLGGALLAPALSLAALTVAAQPVAPPTGVVSLVASASVEVPRDLISVTLSTTREGLDAAAVQTQLKQALDAALAEVRPAARPGQVDVRTGQFSLYPRYGQKGAVTGWQGTAQLWLEGRDIAAISQLAGRVSTLTVARVGYGLSREAREKAESEVTAQAVARFRSRSDELARLFGYTGYTIGEVNVSANEPPPMPMPMLRGQAMAAAAEAAPLPVEPGQGSVTVTVSGNIRLTR